MSTRSAAATAGPGGGDGGGAGMVHSRSAYDECELWLGRGGGT